MDEPGSQPGRGRHQARAPRVPRAAARQGRRWLRRLAIGGVAGLAVVLITVAALFAAGTFRQTMITVHGTEQVVVTSFDGMSITAAFPDITGGSRVTVVDPAGEVIGTGLLSPSDPSSWGPQDAVYAFTVTVPAGEPSYGIEVGRNRGTVWFTEAQLRQGPALSLTG